MKNINDDDSFDRLNRYQDSDCRCLDYSLNYTSQSHQNRKVFVFNEFMKLLLKSGSMSSAKFTAITIKKLCCDYSVRQKLTTFK